MEQISAAGNEHSPTYKTKAFKKLFTFKNHVKYFSLFLFTNKNTIILTGILY